MRLKVSAEFCVLLGHRIGRERTNEEESDNSRENGEARADPEGASVTLIATGSTES